jgi:putative restriction endonuclease
VDVAGTGALLEEIMSALGKYLQMFAKLRRAPNSVFTVATRNRAPHKPILILALLDLVARA